MEKDKLNMDRREFLKRLGIGTGSAMALMAMEPLSAFAQKDKKAVEHRMTYRVQHGSGEQISLLGFGMMRLPNNQEQVNELVDYAIEHGVNYYDTAPMYMRGQSEVLMGNALSRHPRNKYYVATKMSNQGQNTWSFDASKRMYEQSMERLKVDHIDYYLLHGIGGGMNTLKGRFLDNGILDFLLKEREAGRIKHLGFSYHGDVRDFDWLLDHNNEYHWDFVQIQMNFLDWRHASMRGGRRSDADAEYLYGTTGLLSMPTAVMNPGGTFMITANFLNKNYTPPRWTYHTFGYGFDVALWDRIEAAFAFTIFNEEKTLDEKDESGESVKVHVNNQDRHFSAKLLVLREGEFGKDWMPAVAVGVCDIDNGMFTRHSGNNGFFTRYYAVASKTFLMNWGELAAHIGYQFNNRVDYPINAPCAGINWRPIWLQTDWLTLDLVAEYDSLDFNLGFIASLWHDRVEAMFDLQSFRYVSFGLRYKMCLRNY